MQQQLAVVTLGVKDLIKARTSYVDGFGGSQPSTARR